MHSPLQIAVFFPPFVFHVVDKPSLGISWTPNLTLVVAACCSHSEVSGIRYGDNR